MAAPGDRDGGGGASEGEGEGEGEGDGQLVRDDGWTSVCSRAIDIWGVKRPLPLPPLLLLQCRLDEGTDGDLGERKDGQGGRANTDAIDIKQKIITGPPTPSRADFLR
mmetsp:Transcript_30796/g.89577  ORF Transcript_30796/g.89577 Transcript_30796/m.89577 type:complete len:108 (+) Transcript_30796:70-393(+)